MSITKQQFSGYIKQFSFRELFIDMGWNNDRNNQPINVDNIIYSVQAVAEKSGFKILICPPNGDGLIPDSNTRKKIENKISKLFHEHLIIFIDAKKQEQIWQLVVRQSGIPTKLTETRYQISQSPELLFQRASGVFFEMDEEDSITIVDVKQRMTENFHANAEKITKKFYEGFKKEHTSFLSFIKGIDEKTNQEWYASLMLNRLMFCYFIQKKGFLDNNKNYLREKLSNCTEKRGKNKFYSFYRDFLLLLFHQGLNDARQTPEVKKEIGQIPYLNGGLFDEHELEKLYKDIDIDDKAFERVFDFFDQYEWHLDTRASATGKDINPDVIGYIFEKYINDRADMGAYYTKEDITEYIGKNCIIPFLFDETKRHDPKAFVQDGEIWEMVKLSGDRYIYDAVKHGINDPKALWTDLPEDVRAGINPDQDDLVGKRTSWNKPAPADIALPTEIYRELIDRRKRYAEVKTKIENCEITAINDFITYNLNIRQFAIDVIENTNDADFLRHFYKALVNMTLLDPTCGSGAFLFAALNILEELYEASLLRMRNFTEDEDRLNNAEKTSFSNKYQFFRDTLAETQNEHHPNLCYFIYKTIILRNLYGVDIMNEAVEIAKLRLFLKLVATVEVDFRKPNMGLEPLPDIDFNIRAGNTLVGFANEKELERSLIEDMMGALVKTEIEEKCDIVARAFKRYKDIQLSDGNDYLDFKTAKDDLKNRLRELNHELDSILFKQSGHVKFDKWVETHKPFHWFSEYYEIINNNGGFNVVIGNPPYVEYGSKLKAIYSLNDYSTIECGNLHAYVAERCLRLITLNSYMGLIIPLPSISTSRMVSLQNLIKPKSNKKGRNIWISAFDERPSSLFDGVDQRLIIEIIGNEIYNPKLNTTGIKRWYSSTRDNLFPSINYSTQSEINLNYTNSVLKIQNDKIETGVLNKFYQNKPIAFLKSEQATNSVAYYRTAGGRYWKVVVDRPSGTDTVSEKVSYFQSLTSGQVISLLSSSTFWWFYSCHFDMFNLKDYMIFGFRFSDFEVDILFKLEVLGKEYLKSIEENSNIQIINSKTKGLIEQKQYFVSKSKPTIDEIDKVLGAHYGFTQEELDFIINYDIKYRMGKELEEEE